MSVIFKPFPNTIMISEQGYMLYQHALIPRASIPPFRGGVEVGGWVEGRKHHFNSERLESTSYVKKTPKTLPGFY